MPDRPTLFVDRSLGKSVASALKDAGANAEWHDDHFEKDTDDVDWITKVSENNWIILTKDKRIRRDKMEIQAVKGSQARIFTLSSGNMRGDEMARIFKKHLKKIEELANSVTPPIIAVVDDKEVKILN